MACGNHPGLVTASGRAALLGIGLGEALGRAWVQVIAWIQRNRQRRAFADLDDRLLRDIGVSREAAHREIDKLFWRP